MIFQTVFPAQARNQYISDGANDEDMSILRRRIPVPHFHEEMLPGMAQMSTHPNIDIQDIEDGADEYE